MKTALTPIRTLDAFIKAYTQTVALLQLERETENARLIRLISTATKKLQGKVFCPITAVVYMRTRTYYCCTAYTSAASAGEIAMAVAIVVLAAADNVKTNEAFDQNVRALLLEPFRK